MAKAMPAQPRPAVAAKQRRMSSRDATERSAYFARREAARVLRTVLQGDARRRAAASIKSLVYSPSVRNKKATFALVCETLKRLPLLKMVLESVGILKGKWKRQEELLYIVTYDLLFGQKSAMSGAVEDLLALHKTAVQSAFSKICAHDSLVKNQTSVLSKPRYVRVNTLKLDIESAMKELGKTHTVEKDSMIPEVLVLPSGTDLHDHPLVLNGSVFLQGKASSMVAVALSPKPGWKVLDACAAPGNKTVHLASLMRGKGVIVACELHEERARLLKETVRRSGASIVKVLHKDFLSLDPNDPKCKEIRAILLDPSCSGSGISAERLDYLLPSYAPGDEGNSQRVQKLANFQKKALTHALSFPAVERVVYSTCSIHQTENEDVINSVLPLAKELNFHLGTPFPSWPQRGLPVLEGSEHLLRTDPGKDTEGFFIALFVRKNNRATSIHSLKQKDSEPRQSWRKNITSTTFPYPVTNLSRLWVYRELCKHQWQRGRDRPQHGKSKACSHK